LDVITTFILGSRIVLFVITDEKCGRGGDGFLVPAPGVGLGGAHGGLLFLWRPSPVIMRALLGVH